MRIFASRVPATQKALTHAGASCVALAQVAGVEAQVAQAAGVPWTRRHGGTPCTRMATLTAPKSARLLVRDRRPAPYPAHRWATPSRPLASRQPPLPAWTCYAPDVV